MTTNLLLNLHRLPNSLSSQGLSVLSYSKDSYKIQDRRETLIAQKTESALTSEEETELNQYPQLVDYLNLVNETMRKAFLYPLHGRV